MLFASAKVRAYNGAPVFDSDFFDNQRRDSGEAKLDGSAVWHKRTHRTGKLLHFPIKTTLARMQALILLTLPVRRNLTLPRRYNRSNAG
jgi:hypothetical protein